MAAPSQLKDTGNRFCIVSPKGSAKWLLDPETLLPSIPQEQLFTCSSDPLNLSVKAYHERAPLFAKTVTFVGNKPQVPYRLTRSAPTVLLTVTGPFTVVPAVEFGEGLPHLASQCPTAGSAGSGCD